VAATTLDRRIQSDGCVPFSEEQKPAAGRFPQTLAPFLTSLSLSPPSGGRMDWPEVETPVPPPPPPSLARALARAGARCRRAGWQWCPFWSTRACGVLFCAACRRAAAWVHPVRWRAGTAGAFDVQRWPTLVLATRAQVRLAVSVL